MEKPVTDSQVARQWKLMAWLTAEPAGITVADAAEAFGVNLKTIRRDLILLRRLGFDLVETEEQYNRKRWRIRQSLERLSQRVWSGVVLFEMAGAMHNAGLG